jgi:hypothetical protein
VVITGDLINEPASAAQAAEYKRITAKLDSKIRLFSVPEPRRGNEPTKETLARHRERGGADYLPKPPLPATRFLACNGGSPPASSAAFHCNPHSAHRA